MLFKFKVPKEIMSYPKSMKYNEMNDTEGVCARQFGGEIRFK